MDFGHPLRTLCSAIDADVLALLADSREQLSGREVARLTGRSSHSGVIAALRRLAAQGLVRCERVPGCQLFALNRDHLAAPALIALREIESELIKRVQTELRSWSPPPRHASLCGPCVGRGGDAGNAVVLFLVRPAGVKADHPGWEWRLTQLRRDIQRWTGNEAEVIEGGEKDLQAIRRGRLPAGLPEPVVVLRGRDE